MDLAAFLQAAAEVVDRDRIRLDAPLAPLTTFRVGGPADCLIDVRSADELSRIVRTARSRDVPVTMLGGGSNVLVSDAGVRGVVVRVAMTALSEPAPGRVRAEAGCTINGLVRWTIGRGLSGLEAWAGTPGTVGGAICGNAHYGGRSIGERVADVGVMDADGALAVVPADAMAFAYDESRIQRTHEIVVWADFVAGRGEPEALRAVARQSLAHRKATQPLASQSAGCVFQNPVPLRDDLPRGVLASAGALIDRAGLKGHRAGGARISPLHANFVVNEGRATAADIHALIDTARAAVLQKFGVALRTEIVALGDDPAAADSRGPLE